MMSTFNVSTSFRAFGRRFTTALVAAAFAWGAVSIASAEVVTLYDGELQAVTPDNYTPQQLNLVNLGGVTEAFDGGQGATRLNSSGNELFAAGYLNYTLRR